MAAHLCGEERDAALSQCLELAPECAEPARLHPCARAAEGAVGVLALDAVDDEVCDGDALAAQRPEVARALLEGERLVGDFRARDVAAGGQGAPLVPLADVMLFGHEQRGRWLLNIGGMANVTWVPRRGVPDGAFAFDTGPGVAVIDAITHRVDPEATFDAGGERARRGRPVAKLLDELLANPYFDQPPPKSTGRERFGIEYADKLLARVRKAGGSDNDAVATATALTAESIGRAIARWGKDDKAEVVISGGGAKNPALVERLAAKIQPRPVVLFEQIFFNGEAKEAVAFAFLGHQTVMGKAGNLPAATGARGPRILGHITPA